MKESVSHSKDSTLWQSFRSLSRLGTKSLVALALLMGFS